MPDYYETDQQVNEYLVFHYASREQILPWEFGPQQAYGFHARLAQCIDAARLPAHSRALDLGCAVGRTSFELSRFCSEVVGLDFSHAFIERANRIRQSGEIPLRLTREGSLGDSLTNSLPQGVDPQRVRFVQGDAENLPETLGRFDAITFANVLDRLPHPRQALAGLAAIANPGAQLVVCSPFTWWDEFTEPEERLGGYCHDGEEVTSHDSIVAALSDDFELMETRDLPFLIREHQRKYHFSVAQTSLWTRLPD